MTIKMMLEIKNRSHRYGIGLAMDTNTVNIKAKPIRNIWSSIHEKVKQH